MKTSGHRYLEKYTSHFIWKGSKGLLKGLLCERWVGGWTKLQYIDPHSYGHNFVSFPFSWAAQPGAWGPASLGPVPHSSIFSPTATAQSGAWGPPLLGAGCLCRILSPTRTSCRQGYIIILHPLFFLRVSQFALNSTPRQSRLYPDIPRPDAPVIYTGAFPILTAWPGRRSIYNSSYRELSRCPQLRSPTLLTTIYV